MSTENKKRPLSEILGLNETEPHRRSLEEILGVETTGETSMPTPEYNNIPASSLPSDYSTLPTSSFMSEQEKDKTVINPNDKRTQNTIAAIGAIATGQKEHLDKMATDPAYRDEYFQSLGYWDADDYREKTANKLETVLKSIEGNVPDSRFGAKPLSETAIYEGGLPYRSGEEIAAGRNLAKVRSAIKTLRSNNFWSGLGEGFDLADFATLGFMQVGDNVVALEALNKAAKGEKLDSTEQALVDSWKLGQQVENEISLLGGRSVGAGIGRGVGESLPFLTEMVATGGVAAAATKGISKAIAKNAVKKSAKELLQEGSQQVAKKLSKDRIVSGLQQGGLRLAESVVGNAVRVPLTGGAYKNYTGKRLEQFVLDGDDVKKHTTSAWKDALKAGFETFMEYQSEDVGNWIGAPLNRLGGRLAHSSIGKALRLDRIADYKGNAGLTWLRDQAKITNFVGETLGEAYGDAIVNLFENNKDGWRQMLTKEYWWQLGGVSMILQGAFSLPGVVSTDQINYNRRVSALNDIKKNALSNIKNDELRATLTKAAAAPTIAQRSEMLKGINWNDRAISKSDGFNAVKFINAQTAFDISEGEASETERIQRFFPIAEYLENRVYMGKDGREDTNDIVEIADKNGNTYTVIKGDLDTPDAILKAQDAQGKVWDIPMTDVKTVERKSLADAVAVSYAMMFNTQANQELLDRLQTKVSDAVATGVSTEEVKQILDENGVVVFNSGDAVETVNGEQGTVVAMDGDHYFVEITDGTGVTDVRPYGINEIVQPKQTQVEAMEQATAGATASAENVVGSTPEEQAVENVVAQAERVIDEQIENAVNVADGNIYNCVLEDGTEVVIRNGHVVLTEDGDIDITKSDTTIVVEHQDGRKQTIAPQRIAYIASAESAEQAKGNAHEQLRGVVSEQERQSNISVAISNGEPVITADGRQGVVSVAEDGTMTIADADGNTSAITIEDITDVAKPTESATESTPEVVEPETESSDNPLTGRSLTEEEATSVIARMQENAAPAVELELTPENWLAEFGETGMVDTPIGKVKMGEHQIAKLFLNKRNDQFGLIKPTLQSPDVIIEKTSPEDGAERDSKFLFIKTFRKSDGEQFAYFESVTVQKEGFEVSISSHRVDVSAIQKEMQNQKILHLNEKLLFSSDGYLTKPQEEGSDLVPTPNNISSENKDTTSAPEIQIPRLKNGEVDYNAMSPEMFKDYFLEQFGEDALIKLARNNIKAVDKTLNTVTKKIENLVDPNKMASLTTQLLNASRLRKRYEDILELVGVSEVEENDTDRAARLKQESTPRIVQLFPDGLPNAESVVLADIATGKKIRWSDLERNGSVVSRGLGAELGLLGSNKERNKRIALLSNNAPTPEQYAEELPERLNAMGIRYDESALRDIILDAYASVDTRAQAWEALENMAQDTASDVPMDYEDAQMKANYEREQRELNGTSESAPVIEESESATIGDAELSTEEAVPFSLKEDVGLVTDDFTATLSEQEASFIDALARALGVKVEFVDVIPGADANAAIIGKNVLIRKKNRTKAVKFLVGHEFTHRMQDLSPEAYTNFKEAVKAYLGKRFDPIVARLVRNYQAQGVPYTMELIEDEVVADFAGEIALKTTVFDNFLKANAENKSLWQVILDVLRSIRDSFAGLFSSKQERALLHAINKLEDLLEVSSEKAATEQSVTDERYSLKEVNDNFNEQLATLTEENKDKVNFSLGMPSDILLSAGVANKPMKLYGAKVVKKQKMHGFKLDELKDLPMAVANPIAVFNNYQRADNRSILTELKTKDGNFLVSLNVGKDQEIDFNIVATVFGKDGDKIIDWFAKGYATYVNKEKALNYLHHSAPIAEALRNPRLNTITKIVQNFENPTIGPKYSLKSTPVFYSNAENAVRNIKQEKATPEQWLKMIEKNGGLKAGEDKWLELSDWLKVSDKRSLTKQEVLGYIENNKIKIEEVSYGDIADISKDDIYASDEFLGLIDSLTEYKTDENGDETPYISRAKYEELRSESADFVDGFTLDYWGEELEVDSPAAAAEYLGLSKADKVIDSSRLRYTTDGLTNKREIALTVPTIEPWDTNDEIHFGDAGGGRAIAWVRFGEAADEDGNRVLVIDEIQSKRHQEGREKGYKTIEDEELRNAQGAEIWAMMQKYNVARPADLRSVVSAEDAVRLDEFARHKFGEVPSAPFEKNWAELAMKRMLRYAAENGYDKVAWTTGEQQADRYNMSTSVSKISRRDNNLVEGKRFMLGGNTVLPHKITINDEGIVISSTLEGLEGRPLADVVGKEMAVKMMQMENNTSLEDADLKIGGSGMKTFYDTMLVNFMNKYGKKWGVKVGEVTMPNLEENNTMHSVDVTPAMRESVMQGQPMFSLRELSAEEQEIIKTAKSNGSYLKAPNGADSNLTPRQWVQVRTKAFKEWFGDWEKAARIEKLRQSESIVVPYDVNVGKYELNRESAESYLLNELRGEYIINDTNEKVVITRKGAKKVTSHSSESIPHLKSIAAIPQMLENAIFIEEASAEKDDAQYDYYRYYVCGLRLGAEDYTARITIGVKGGKYFYDHALTNIEKGNLIEIAQGFIPNGGQALPSYAESKDTRIIPLLQTNSSKVVDANGEPKVVYNGSKVQHYNYDGRLRTKGQSATNSKVSFFTDSRAVAERYGEFVNEVFLNIRNPYEVDYKGAGWQGWSGAEDGMQRMSTDSYADLLANGTYDSTLGAIIENYGRAEADYLATGKVFNEGIEPDGVIAYNVADPMRSTLYIVRNAEAKDLSRESVTPKGVETFTKLGKSSLLFDSQIKSATDNIGTFEPREDDIRYSVKDIPSLVGIHNISLEKLEKAIRMGGSLANPSIAVLDIDKSDHSDYGDYSLILPKDMVDARLGRNAGTWAGDAWTPTYPAVVKKIKKNADISRFYKDINKMPKAMSNRVALDFNSFLEGRSANALYYWYLFEKGDAPELRVVPSKYPVEIKDALNEVTNGSFSMFNLTTEQREKCVDVYVAQNYGGDRAAYEQDLRGRLERLQKFVDHKNGLVARKAQQDLADITEYGFDYDAISGFIRDVEYDMRHSGEVDVDATVRAAQEQVQQSNMEGDFDKWKESLDAKYGIEEFIFDGYTPSGNQKWLPHTTANVSKWMKKQGRVAATGTFPSFGLFIATVIPRMTSLESIRKRKKQLGNTQEVYDAFKEKWEDTYYNLGQKLQPGEGRFEDYGWWRLIEAATKTNPQKYIKDQYNIEFSNEDMSTLNTLLDAIKKEYPAKYFETKFERPVALSEFAAAVVPNTIPEEVEKYMRSAYLNVYKYDKSVDGSQREATLKAVDSPNIRFSIRESSDNSILVQKRSEFEKLTEEYNALLQNRDKNPNFDEALNEWRDRKAIVLYDYLTAYAQSLGIDHLVTLDIFNTRGDKSEYGPIVDMWMPGLSDEERNEIIDYLADPEVGGIHIRGTSGILMDMSHSDNRSLLGYETVFIHEFSHLDNELLTENEFIEVYNESSEWIQGAEILKEYRDKGKEPWQLADELLSIAMDHIHRRGALGLFIDGAITVEKTIESLKYSKPLMREILIRKLNRLKDYADKATTERASRLYGNSTLESGWNEGESAYSNGRYGRDLEDVRFSIRNDETPTDALKRAEKMLEELADSQLSPEEIAARIKNETGWERTPNHSWKYAFSRNDWNRAMAPIDAVIQDAITERKKTPLQLARERISQLYRELRSSRKSISEIIEQLSKEIRGSISTDLVEVMGKRDFDNIIRIVEGAVAKGDIEQALRQVNEQLVKLEEASLRRATNKMLSIKLEGTNPRGVSVSRWVDQTARVAINTYKDSVAKGVRAEDLEQEFKDEWQYGQGEKYREPLAMWTAIDLLQHHDDIQRYDAELADIDSEIADIRRQNSELFHQGRAAGQAGNREQARLYYNGIKVNKEIIADQLAERLSIAEKRNGAMRLLVKGLNETIMYGRSAFAEARTRREQEKAAIVSMGFDDCADWDNPTPMQDEELSKGKQLGLEIQEFLTSPGYSMNTALKLISVNAPGGEGALYNHFVKGRRGYLASQAQFYTEYNRVIKEYGDKAQEVFGKPYEQVLNDSDKDSVIAVNISNGKRLEQILLTYGEAMYLYMADKMMDGRVKIRKMGISEEDMDAVAASLPPQYIRFADWVQGEFLPSLRDKYNATHIECFGIPMSEVDNYVPLKVLKSKTYQEVDGSGREATTLPSAITGSIIKRTRNTLPIDLHTNAFEVIRQHVEDMEHWNAYTFVIQDMNALLSSTEFRRMINHLHPGMHKKLKELAQVTTGTYSSEATGFDKGFAALNKVAATSKIAFRINTALKQILSYPAFYAYAVDSKYWAMLTRNISPDVWKRNFTWALKNSPIFRERWEGRTAGNEKLSQATLPAFDNIIKHINNAGMFPNAFIDALTCANGAKAVYDYKLEYYKEHGYDAAEADRLALIDATISLNETQQSSEGLFLSVLQSRRDFFAVAISTFQNSNFAYLRKQMESIRELFRNRAKQIENRTKYYEKQGMESGKAAELARKDVKDSKLKAGAELFVFSFLLNTMWTLGGKIWQYAFGDDDDREEIPEEALKAFAMSPVRNTTIGSMLESIAGGYGASQALFFTDLQRAIEEIQRVAQNDPKSWDQTAFWLTCRILITNGVGVDLTTFANMYQGIAGMIRDGADVEDVMYILNAPQSQAKLLAGKPKEGETLDEYQKRMAFTFKRFKEPDKKDLSRWEKQYIAGQQRKLLIDHGYSFVEIDETSKRFNDVRKIMGITRGGKLNEDARYGSKHQDAKEQELIRELLRNTRIINAKQKQLERMVDFNDSYLQLMLDIEALRKEAIEKYDKSNK